MLTSRQVADYFLAQCNEEEGDLISNMKVQKLVYYAQGLHLALYDEPLFPESLVAWAHGPVVPELYHAFKQYGSGPLPAPKDLDFDLYDTRTHDLLDEVYNVYGQFSAWKLSLMTHQEPPWKETPINGVISHELLRSYFKSQVSDA